MIPDPWRRGCAGSLWDCGCLTGFGLGAVELCFGRAAVRISDAVCGTYCWTGFTGWTMPDSAAVEDDDDDDDDAGFVSHVHVHVPLPLPLVPSLYTLNRQNESILPCFLITAYFLINSHIGLSQTSNNLTGYIETLLHYTSTFAHSSDTCQLIFIVFGYFGSHCNASSGYRLT